MSRSFSLASARSVLVTGGTGSFGRAFVGALLERYPDIPRVVVYSRDELKQSEMAREPAFAGRRLRFFIGDVRDRDRLGRAMEGVDVVVHAAALKQVEAAEYNPFEAIKTNVLGAQNVIESALDHGVRRVVALSTDKAAAPINLYGATKLCADKLFVAGNNFKGARDLALSVVRYGNVLGSRGSVVPLFQRLRATGVLPITHPEMTRFTITIGEAVDCVLRAIETMWGGEIFVPRIPSYRLLDLAAAIAPDARHQIIGIRPGEKLHEELITAPDAASTVEVARGYVILPVTPHWNVADFLRDHGARPVPPDFHYHSAANPDFLSVDALRTLVGTLPATATH